MRLTTSDRAWQIAPDPEQPGYLTVNHHGREVGRVVLGDSQLGAAALAALARLGVPVDALIAEPDPAEPGDGPDPSAYLAAP